MNINHSRSVPLQPRMPDAPPFQGLKPMLGMGQDTVSIRFQGSDAPAAAGKAEGNGEQKEITVGGKRYVLVESADAKPEPEKELPMLSRDASMVIRNLKGMLHPGKASETWPIAMVKFLCMDTSVKAYLEKQGLEPTKIFDGMHDTMTPKYKDAVFNQKMNEDLYNSIVQGSRQFAQEEGLEKVTPVTLWRWMMVKNPSGTIDELLLGSGFNKEMSARIRKAPLEVLKTWRTFGRPTKEDIKTQDATMEKLPNIVLGQKSAMKMLAESMEEAMFGYDKDENPHKPPFVTLLLGPSGVGKTYAVKQLAKLTGREVIYEPMNQYKDDQNVARLTGAAPGYVGYGDGGSHADRLIRANEKTAKTGAPPPIVLYDEIEKASVKCNDVLMQAMDQGLLQNGTGQTASFEGAPIIFTSNIAQREIAQAIADGKSQNEIQKIVKQELEKQFRPEFIGRLNSVIIFDTLKKEDAAKILDVTLNRYIEQAKNQDGIVLEITSALKEKILDEGFSEKFGARELKNVARRLLHVALVAKRKELVLNDMLPPPPTGKNQPVPHAGKMVASWDGKNVTLDFTKEWTPAPAEPPAPQVETKPQENPTVGSTDKRLPVVIDPKQPQ